MSEQETVEALSIAVKDIDQSRRVGWASSFSAKEKLNDALRDVNILTTERDLWRDAASYLHGYLIAVESALPGMHGTGAPRERKRYLTAIGVAGTSEKQKQGQGDGRNVMDEYLTNAPLNEAERIAKRVERRERRAAERPMRDLVLSMADQYHTTPAVMRTALKALRDALRGSGVAAHGTREGWTITVKVER